MQSVAPSNLSPDFRRSVEKIGIMRGKIETLTGLRAMEWLNNHRKMAERNQEAENRFIRKNAWGETAEQAAGNGEDMGHTILGDVLNPAPIVINSPPSHPSGGGLARGLAALAIGALIPSVGIGGYLLSQMMNPDSPVVVPSPTTDDSLDIGLGRFEDLKP